MDLASITALQAAGVEVDVHVMAFDGRPGEVGPVGALCSMTSSMAGCGDPNSSLSMVGLVSRARFAAVWDGVSVQRCTVQKHRNLLAHASERLHEEINDDYNDMIYAATRKEIETQRKAFIRKWPLKHRAVVDSLEEAGDQLLYFHPVPPRLSINNLTSSPDLL